MEKEFFYAPDIKHETDEFGNPLLIHEISTEDIKHLALYIVENIEPLSDVVTIAEGYISALTYYSKDNKNFPYYEIFEQLKYGENSRFLYFNVMLALMENDFRKEGIDEKKMHSYNKWQEQYKRMLEFNQQLYREMYNTRKIK